MVGNVVAVIPAWVEVDDVDGAAVSGEALGDLIGVASAGLVAVSPDQAGRTGQHILGELCLPAASPHRVRCRHKPELVEGVRALLALNDVDGVPVLDGLDHLREPVQHRLHPSRASLPGAPVPALLPHLLLAFPARGWEIEADDPEHRLARGIPVHILAAAHRELPLNLLAKPPLEAVSSLRLAGRPAPVLFPAPLGGLPGCQQTTTQSPIPPPPQATHPHARPGRGQPGRARAQGGLCQQAVLRVSRCRPSQNGPASPGRHG